MDSVGDVTSQQYDEDCEESMHAGNHAPKKKRRWDTDTHSDHVMGITCPDERTDVAFLVEGKKLYFNKLVISWASPVFKAMFESSFKESKAHEIVLPGKSYQSFLELLKWLIPGTVKAMTRVAALALIPLADEYQLQELKIACETFLLRDIMQKDLSLDLRIIHIIAAQHSPDKLLTPATEKLSRWPLLAVKQHKDFDKIPQGVIMDMMDRRLSVLDGTLEKGLLLVMCHAHERDEFDKECDYDYKYGAYGVYHDDKEKPPPPKPGPHYDCQNCVQMKRVSTRNVQINLEDQF